ncbi:MAG TPA: DUF4397 domain-containing protein [Flavitalea sp.]|nr:DUF4397 domain-containing protein [Flavitalea sp.]
MQIRKASIVLWGLTFTLAFGMSACTKSNIPAPPAARSYVSILHLAATAPSLEVFFDNTKVSSNPFTPGAVSAAYNPVDRGNFPIIFKKAGSDSVVANVPSVMYDSLHYYTIFVYNLQANGPVQAFRIEDDFRNVTLSKSFYRFLHASPNTGAVDLYIDNTKNQTGRILADNTGQVSFNNFLETATGYHNFQVKLAGTDSTIASQANVELLSGAAYTIYLKGLSKGSGSSQLSLNVLRATN